MTARRRWLHGVPLFLGVLCLSVVWAGGRSPREGAASTAGRQAGLSAAAVPRAYTASKAQILGAGRSIGALVRAGDAEGVVARFAPALALAVPRAQVERVLAETVGVAPIGKRLGESVLPLAPDQGGYLADYRWGTKTLALEVMFDARGAIASIDLRPRQALPRDPNATYRQHARLSLPFRGAWWVFWGGRTERQNYHVIAPDQRHAYDLVAWQAGATHRGAGAKNTDYWAWGRAVLAPATGRVVEVVDGVRDNHPRVQVQNPANPAGNHVVLDLGNGEYALLAHLRKGSVRVRRGEMVRRGDLLGACGNSGNSSEPHLHFHVQDRPELFGPARGLPVTFEGYRADGASVMRGTPVQGQFIESLRSR
jgi:murein DD-endopeptidase MepM/ murein hydrolase activator NlpD